MFARKPKLGMMAGVFAVSIGAAPASLSMASPARLEFLETVDVAPRVFAYRLAGDFSRVGARIDLRLQVSAGSLFRRGGDGLGRGL